MNCKRIKELLLTDYIDNEIDEKTKNKLDQHLAGCQDCMRLKDDLLISVKEPFKNVQKLEVPQTVWINIKDSIQEDNPSAFSIRETFENIQDFLFGHKKPALAFATSLFVAVIVLTFLPQRLEQKRISKTVFNDNVDFIFYLEDKNGSNYGRIDLGTGIEEFFL